MLASPIIEGTLPAFYLEKGIATIAVPFSRSRAVSDYEVSGYHLKIKNLQGSEYLLNVPHSRYNSNKSTVYFDIPEETVKNVFSIGSFYKAQLAYVDNNKEVGYYSTVGVVKYTTKPEVSILNLNSMKDNGHLYSYTGLYSQKDKDFTEKEYSYRFVVKDMSGVIVEDTGYIIHNYSKNTNHYESQDEFLFSRDLQQNEKFIITYSVKTNNGLEIQSPPYRIIAKTTLSSTLISSINADLDYDNGYVKITMRGEEDPETHLEKMIKGSFMLSRASEKSNYLDWETLDYFSLASVRPSSKEWKDFTIEQGVKYKYCVQQYNKQNLFSQRLMSNIVYADFEDCFLYDGNKQLKIRFNPKVASFKTNLLESKIDTIGSKYPFIFKNGNVDYKEFPISGLISRIMDEQGLFLEDANEQKMNLHRNRPDQFVPISFPLNASEYIKESKYKTNYTTYYVEVPYIDDKGSLTTTLKKWTEYLLENNIPVKRHGYWSYCSDLFLNHVHNMYALSGFSNVNKNIMDESHFLLNTNLTSLNMQKERDFKLEVFNWLTNGEPKLFKSPSEGNYLVRLMNVSLTPEEKLGRMLHNFSCTAYEVDTLTYDTLVQYNIINVNGDDGKYLKIISIPLHTKDRNWALLSQLNFSPSPENNTIGPFYAQGNLIKMNRVIEWAVLEDVEPGTQFTIDGSKIVIGNGGKYEIPFSVSQISLDDNQLSTGILTYAYYGEINDSFSKVVNITEEEVISQQFIGQYTNVIDEINDTITQIAGFKNIKFLKRPIQELIAKKIPTYEPISIDYDFIMGYPSIYQNYFIKNDKGEIIPAPPTYKGGVNYYKEVILYDLYDERGNLIAHMDNKDMVTFVSLKEQENDNINPLYIYHFTKDYSHALNSFLYRKISFIKTEKQDNAYVQDREYSFRTSTNPYLMNERDFYLFVANGDIYVKDKYGKFNLLPLAEDTLFNPDIDYYLKEDIEFYLDPFAATKNYRNSKNNIKTNQLYIGRKSYEGFVKDTGISNLAPLKEFNYQIFLNSNQSNIDLTNKEEFNTGGLENVQMITMPIGVYCELSYQALKIDYDIESNAILQSLKNSLDNDKYKLSKEYLVNKVLNSSNPTALTDYSNELDRIYNEYNSDYEAYLVQLQKYLKEKEEE